jgi:hypothetical protein
VEETVLPYNLSFIRSAAQLWLAHVHISTHEAPSRRRRTENTRAMGEDVVGGGGEYGHMKLNKGNFK